jgi:hypothetical protein
MDFPAIAIALEATSSSLAKLCNRSANERVNSSFLFVLNILANRLKIPFWAVLSPLSILLSK